MTDNQERQLAFEELYDVVSDGQEITHEHRALANKHGLRIEAVINAASLEGEDFDE